MYIAIQIINFKYTNITIECLKSISRNNFSNIHIFILDNESTNLSYRKIKNFINKSGRNLKIDLIKSDLNLGFASGHNYIYKFIKKFVPKKFDFHFILNSDAILPVDFFLKFDEIITTKKHNFDVFGFPIYSIKGNCYLYANGVLNIPLGIIELSKYIFSTSSINKIFFPIGAALMINSNFLKLEKKIFDDDFFLYFEELELVCRLKNKQKKYTILNDMKIYHDHGQSMNFVDKKNILKEFNYHRSKLIFYIKYYPRFLFLIKIQIFIKSLFHLIAFRINNFFNLFVLLKLNKKNYKKKFIVKYKK